MRYLFLLTIGLLLAAFMLSGCSGGGSNPIQGIGAPGTVRLLLADAPVDDISALNLNIVRIDLLYEGAEESEEIGDEDGDGDFEDPDDIEGPGEDMVAAVVRDDDEGEIEHEDDDQAITIFQGDTVVNLLDLANQPLDNLLQLSQVAVPSGEYKAIIIYLGTNNSVTLLDGTTVQPLIVTDNKLEIELDTFIMPGENDAILLDFDLSDPETLQAPLGDSGWVYDPHVRVASLNNSGSVTGVLGVPDGFNPTDDFEVKIAIPTLDDEVETEVEVESDEESSGNPFAFHLNGVPAGTYTVSFHVEYGDQTATFTAPVTVTDGGTVDMGTVPVTGITF